MKAGSFTDLIRSSAISVASIFSGGWQSGYCQQVLFFLVKKVAGRLLASAFILAESVQCSGAEGTRYLFEMRTNQHLNELSF